MSAEAYLLDLVAGQEVQVLMNSTCAMDVAVRRVRSSTSVPVDPLEPMLSTVAGNQVLKIIGSRDALSFDGAKEVLLDWIAVVAKGDLDRALEAVDVTIVA